MALAHHPPGSNPPFPLCVCASYVHSFTTLVALSPLTYLLSPFSRSAPQQHRYVSPKTRGGALRCVCACAHTMVPMIPYWWLPPLQHVPRCTRRNSEHDMQHIPIPPPPDAPPRGGAVETNPTPSRPNTRTQPTPKGRGVNPRFHVPPTLNHHLHPKD